jgi:arylsulfatase A-like enzyme
MITGMMPTTIGIHHHRSSRTVTSGLFLPDVIKTLPALFREAGYFTFNAGKDDYNFIYDRRKLYSGGTEVHYWHTFGGHPEDTWNHAERKHHQPFFGQIQLRGGKHVLARHQAGYDAFLPAGERIDRKVVELPPYYPEHPVIREDWAAHHDSVRITDKEVGDILDKLEADRLLDNTVIFLFSGHGYHGTRHEAFCYDGGIHVPLIAAWFGNPRKIKPATVNEELVSLLDVSATSLALAGIPVPKGMEGRDLLAGRYRAREFVISTRDRCDFAIDRIRSVRTNRYKYIKNFHTDRTLMQPSSRDTRPEYVVQKQLKEQGRLNDVQARVWSDTRVPEELYDLQRDPHEIHNIVDDLHFREVLDKHRRILDNWIRQTDDQGQYPEGIEGLRFVVERWGRRCINPEYQKVRDNPMPGMPDVDMMKESI